MKPHFIPRTGPKRSARQREQDLETIARWWLERRTEREIVGLLNKGRASTLSQTTIHSDIVEIRKRWQETTVELVAERKAADLAALELVEREAWDSWREKKKDRDPRWLDQVLKVVESRRKLLGLDAPSRSEMSGPGGSPLVGSVVIELPDNGRPLYPEPGPGAETPEPNV